MSRCPREGLITFERTTSLSGEHLAFLFFSNSNKRKGKVEVPLMREVGHTAKRVLKFL